MQITKLEESFRAVRVAASDSASLALSDKGEVRVWGSFRVSGGMSCSSFKHARVHADLTYFTLQAADGLLGFDNNTKIQTLPVSLPGMARLPVAEIACGENHVLLLTNGGQVYSFGNGETGQLGRCVCYHYSGSVEPMLQMLT
jgi:regulator of chromosome condensation